MKRFARLTTLLALSFTSAHAATLAEQLPAGALMTLETRNATGTVDRLMDVFGRVAEAVLGEDAGEMTSGFGQILNGSVGRESVVGVFSVAQGRGRFTPHVLGVTRADALANEFFGSVFEKKKGARVGRFPFSRQGDIYAGQYGGLVYFSTNKTLLMNALARLSGKAAPRLMDSGAYTTPTRGAGTQEVRTYVNFSATAKVIRSGLGQVAVPRLLSPVVDALDTLGQYAGGFTTTAAGVSTASAHAVNVAGKDQPLARILRHRTDFQVQNLIPADAEAVQASACAPETASYLGRWLTRVDLLDPVGFLTDSQLASHLERSARYLGDECAQVTLAGGTRAGLQQDNPLAALRYTVTYQRVTDRAAAEAHLPEYVGSVNTALAGVGTQLDGWLGTLMGDETMADLMDAQTTALLGALKNLKMMYAFEGDYLLTAFSDEALEAAQAGAREALAQDAGFRAAALPMSGAGWTYAPNQADLTADELAEVLGTALTGGGAGAELDMLSGMLETVAPALADLINRYDGQTAWADVQGNVVLRKGQIKYRW